MERYKVTLKGKTPLLMHHDDIDWADRMDAWKNDPANKRMSKAGDDRTPAFRWIGCLYHDWERVCIPNDNIMRSIMEGGAMVPVPGGRGNKTFKSQTQSGIMLAEPFWPLTVYGAYLPIDKIHALIDESDFSVHRERVKEMGFSIFLKRAKIGMAKHIRVRPRFDNWAISGELIVADSQITEAVLRDILTYAGQYKGLCDWRPGGKTPGSYGMFTATVEPV
jgi:hypothetical protein